MSRRKAAVVIFIVVWIVGALCSLSFGPLNGVRIFGRTIFDFLDQLSANFLMTVGAFLLVVFVGWKMPKKEMAAEFTNDGTIAGNHGVYRYMRFIIRYIAPIAILVILISGILS